MNLKNNMNTNTFLLALAICLPLSTMAQHNHGAQTPYAGMQNRAIKSLSDNDINELRRGGGWGLALSAELNGMPGPAHLLEQAWDVFGGDLHLAPMGKVSDKGFSEWHKSLFGIKLTYT